MRKKEISFKNKVLIPVIAIFVISVLIISIINYRLLYATVEAKTNENLNSYIVNIHSQIKHLDTAVKITTQVLGEKNISIAKSAAYILEKQSDDLTTEEVKKIADFLDLIELNIADSDGIMTYSNIEGYVGFIYNSTAPTSLYMQLTDGTRTEYSEVPRADAISGNNTHYAGVSRLNDHGFVQLGFDASILDRLKKDINIQIPIEDITIGEHGFGMVLSYGLVLAHPDQSNIGKNVSREDWYKTVSADDGFKWLVIDGIKYYAGFNSTEGNTVIGLVTEDDFYKELNAVRRGTIIFLAVGLAIMFTVLHLLLDSLVMPIKKLSEALSNIARGSLNVSVTTDARDEIGQLSRNLAIVVDQFVSMTDDINSRVNDAVSGELSKRVETSRYPGDWSYLMNGLNSLLDAIVLPINEASNALHKIAKGDFSARVSGDYKGEFAIIKHSVNTTAQGIESYINDKLEAERKAHESILAKGRAEAATEAIIDSISYASRIQRNLLPKDAVFKQVFSDYSIIWSPRDIVSGDIYWLKRFDKGAVLCVCDCTGHGAPGAFLTMLVVSAFEALVDEHNYYDTAQIIWMLEQRLVSVLHVAVSSKDLDEFSDAININDGCDLAVLYIANNGSVTVSSGYTHVFVCDGNEVTQLKGQKLHVGDGSIKHKNDIKTVVIPKNPNNKFYVASDGLFDQIGGKSSIPFGYRTFKKIILEHHHKTQASISKLIWEAFEHYRGEEPRRDDVEVITFEL